MMRAINVGAGLLVVIGALVRPADAQRQTIEIRGQVPTPQIVTVRPREVPEFSTQVLVPAFYNHQFWPVILPAYQIVQRSEVYGVMATDSMPVGAGEPIPVAGAPNLMPDEPAARRPGGADTAQANVARPQVPAATTNEEIEALRRELELRRARIDSIDAARKRELDALERAIRERQRQQRERVDSTAKPPGTPPAPLR
jgi:hypothetical protein